MRVKYIVTEEEKIVIFSELQQHSEFSRFSPISAGFISIGLDEKGGLSCSCYGSSVSLKLDSRPKEDTELANRQIINAEYI